MCVSNSRVWKNSLLLEKNWWETSAYVNSSSIGCWARRVMASTTKAELPDFPHLGLSVTPVNPNLLWHADAIIHEDQCFTNRQLVFSLLIGKGSVMSLRSSIFECVNKGGSTEPHSWTQNWQKSHFFQVVGTYGNWGRDSIADFYVRWNVGPSCWTIDTKAICGMVPSPISEEEQSHQEGRSWSLYSGTVQESFLWMWCQEGGTVNWCSRMLTSRKRFRWVQPHKNPVLFQHGNTRLQRSLKTQESITKFGPIHPVASICHPQIHTYLLLKDAVCSDKFDTDVDVICAVRTGLHEQDKAWYWLGIHTLVTCWHEAIKLDRVFVEK